jgi:hypothetical protein
MKRLIILAVLFVPVSIPSFATAADFAEEPVTKTLVWPDGTRYVGGVVDGKRTGKGTIFWQDGTRFVGQFENDMRNGPGTMILPDGTVYTGFFKNDELVDTEATIAASNAQESVELNAEDSAAALEDTDIPMEADSLGSEEVATESDEPLPQVDEGDLVEVAAEEPFIEAEPDYPTIVEAPSDEPFIDEPFIDEPVEEAVTVIDEQEPEVTFTYTEEDPYSSDVTQITEAVKEDLIETIDLWAAAWTDQNVPQYLVNYSNDFRVPGRQSRRTWEALRRTRLTRPRYINLDVVYQRFEFVETNVVDVFFRQSYRSNTYSDLTDKVLRMRKEENDWKVLIERSR